MASARRERVPLTGRSNASAAAARTTPSLRTASRMAGTPSGVSQWSGRPVDPNARSGAAGPNINVSDTSAGGKGEAVPSPSGSARRARIMQTFMSGAGAKKRSDDTARSTDAYSEWNNTHHITAAARDNHVFGYGLGGAGRHEQVLNGTTPMEVFEKKDAPLPTSTVDHHTNWRDDPKAIPRRRPRKGRPQGSEGIEAFDIDGDGAIDESEVLISSFMQHERKGKPKWEDPMWGGDGKADHVPQKLTPRSIERKKQQKIDQGRREMIRRYWNENRDQLWCIDPGLRGKGISDSIDALMQTCEDKYRGNFALMMRNLHHDADQIRSKSSVQAQMVVRPPITCRVNGSLEVAGYKDGYETARMKQEERINRVYAQIAKEGRGAVNPGGYDYNRKKGTEYAYGNMAGWCAARAKHPFAAHL